MVIKKREELITDLLNRSPLAMYNIDNEFVYPKIYTADRVIYANTPGVDLPDVVDLTTYKTGNLYYLAPSYFSTGSRPKIQYKSKKQLLTMADQVVVVGSKNLQVGIANKVLSGLSTSSHVGLPNPSVDPTSFMYNLVRFKEKLILLKERNFAKKIDTLNWFAAKRLSEIEKYNVPKKLRKALLEDFVALYGESCKLLLSTKDAGFASDKAQEVFWIAAWSSYSRLIELIQRGQNLTIPGEGYWNVDSIVGIYKDLLTDYSYFSSEPKEVYSFEIPESGTYSVMLKSGDSSWAKASDINYSEPDAKTYDIDLTDSVSSLTDTVNLQTGNFTTADVSKLISIPEWRPQQRYKLRLNSYIYNAVANVSIVEDLAENLGGYTRKTLVTKKLGPAGICLDFFQKSGPI